MPERTPRNRSRKSFLWYLGRWAWVFLVAEIGLLIFVPVFFANKIFHTQVIAGCTAVFIGLLSALLTRRLIGKSSLFLRILFPLVSLLICLAGINWITAGQAGFGSLHDPLYGSPWWGLIPLALGTATIVLTLLAWRKPRKRKTIRRQPQPADISESIPAARQESPHRREGIPEPHPGSMPALAMRRESTAALAGQSASTTAAAVRSLPTTRRRNKNNHLRLSGTEEHRCPYCLEVVEANDPRGVVICEICHAYHHKDCWDITGRCQVPHQSVI